MPRCWSCCSPPTTAIVIMKTFTTSGNLLEIEHDKTRPDKLSSCLFWYYQPLLMLPTPPQTTWHHRDISKYLEISWKPNIYQPSRHKTGKDKFQSLPPFCLHQHTTAVSASWQDWFITSSSAQARGCWGLVTPRHHSGGRGGAAYPSSDKLPPALLQHISHAKVCLSNIEGKTLDWFDSEYQITQNKMFVFPS